MRTLILPALVLASVGAWPYSTANAETVGKTVLPEPQPSWFVITGTDASHLFDAADGEMKGSISHNWYTTAIVTLPSRREAYFVDSYFTRGVTGERSDLVAVVDMTDLTTKAEIDIPEKAAALHIRQHIALLGDERHLVVFNMTPAQSVSIVDVVDRRFVGEISIAGCAVIMPVETRSFLTLCGDGTLQLIRLDESGQEATRVRSRAFFDVEKDPVFDRVVHTGTGWLLVTHEGTVREVDVEGDRIRIGDTWSMLKDDDKKEKWRPGGEQPFTMHRSTRLLYSLMHKGETDTQDQEGIEIWAFDPGRRKRVARLVLPAEASNILSSQEPSPRLYVVDKDRKLSIYDGRLLRLQRTIEKIGLNYPLLQVLAPND
jgi:methylamine dehydrogenase heavy chain